MEEHQLSSGVQELINRLREEGVAAGRQQAETRLAQARAEAKRIVEEARRDAAEIIATATQEAARYRRSAGEAMELAARDTVLELKSTLTTLFSRRVAGMVGETINEAALLRQIILTIAGTIREQIAPDQELEVLLPTEIVGLAELRRHPEKVKEGALGQFVLSTAQEMFRDGVTIKTGSQKKGLQIKLVEKKLVIDINEKVISEIMLQHLLPRFKALLEGSIQ